MDQYLADYGLKSADLRAHLSRHNCTLAGSFALSCYMKIRGVDPGFEPNDIDIWVPHGAYAWSLERYFKDNGYTRSDKFDRQNQYSHDKNIITNIVALMKNGKEIQLIYIKFENVLDYIKTCFDLSCCITWLDNASGNLETLIPELTLKKEMKLLLRNDKTCSRCIKYEQRGFTLIDNMKKKKDRFSKLLPVYDFYCNVRGFDCDKDRRYYKPRVPKTYNAAILIKNSYCNSRVNPTTYFGTVAMFEGFNFAAGGGL